MCWTGLSLVVAHQPLRDKLQGGLESTQQQIRRANGADELDQAYVCCLTCRHGGGSCFALFGY